MKTLKDSCLAVICGQAVGDALGGATEGWSPQAIEERHGGRVTGIVGPFLPDWATARPLAPYHKGDGHVTDDTLMTHALIEVYAKRRSHLDAYAMVDDLVPIMMGEPRWVPELETSVPLLQRVFLAEKWMVSQLWYAHADPREAGKGNIVNCGAAMYMAPVGLVNPGDPGAAYREAIDMAGAHQSSFGREAAGVFAAAVAASVGPGATLETVLEAVFSLAKDGTRSAIDAVLTAVSTMARPTDDDSERELARVVRSAVAPFDTVGSEDYRSPCLDARRPSRTKSIEELPVALGLLMAHRGDYRSGVLAAVNYGRDSDSIAGMLGAVAAGLGGPTAVPPEWLDQIETASQVDIRGAGRLMGEVAVEIATDDLRRTEVTGERLAKILSATDER